MEGKRNVLAVVGTSDYSGGSRIFLNFLTLLPQERYNIVGVICPPSPRQLAESFEENARNRGLVVYPESKINNFFPILNVVKYCFRFRHFKQCIILSSNIQNAMRFASFFKVGFPNSYFVVLGQNSITYAGFSIFWWLKKFIYQFITRFMVDKFIFLSEALRTEISNMYDINHSRSEVIPGYVDTSLLIPDSSTRLTKRRELLGDNHDEKIIVLTNSRISRQKGLTTFVEAAGFVAVQRKDIIFFIAGEAQTDDDRNYKSELDQMIKSLCLENIVHFLGWRKDTSELLNAADVYVATSHWEGLNLSIIEAMAMEKPVVVTNFGPANEVVDEGESGFICPIHDSEGISTKILLLCADSKLRFQMGKNGRTKVKKSFSPDIVKKKIIEVLSSLS